MAWQMATTTEDGIYHVASYWRLADIRLDWARRYCWIRFVGHHDDTTRLASRREVAEKAYVVGGAEFNTWFGAAALDVSSPITQAYKYAKQCKEPEVSFFATALEV